MEGPGRWRLPRECDQGTEFTSKALDHWAYWNQVKLDFSRPGKPTDNAVAESFLASLRRECLTLHWFVDLEEAQDRLNRWREDHNNVRHAKWVKTFNDMGDFFRRFVWDKEDPPDPGR